MEPYPPNQKTVRKRAKVHIVVVIRVLHCGIQKSCTGHLAPNLCSCPDRYIYWDFKEKTELHD